MTKNEEVLLRFKIFKTITEYQIQWLSTSYDLPGLTYHVIIKKFPQVEVKQAIALLNEWIEYEKNLKISFYNKVKFADDSNVETIMQLKKLITQLDNHINLIKSQIQQEKPTKTLTNSNSFEIKKTEDGITITFLNPSWFKRNNVVNLTFEVAKELCEKLNALL